MIDMSDIFQVTLISDDLIFSSQLLHLFFHHNYCYSYGPSLDLQLINGTVLNWNSFVRNLRVGVVWEQLQFKKFLP